MPTIPDYLEIKTAAGQPVAYLSPEADKIKEVFLDRQLNGASTLSFLLPVSSKKWSALNGANRIIIGGRKFVIMSPDAIEKSRDGRRRWGKVTAHEIWYLMGKKFVTVSNDPQNPTPAWGTVAIISGGAAAGGFSPGTAGSALTYLLQGSGWTVGTVDVTGIFDLETEKDDLLSNIKKVQEIWGGILIFNSDAMTVSLRSESAWQNYTGFQIRYAKNLKHITRTEDHDVITRLYPFGTDDLNIGSVNNGQIYLDNTQYTTEILEHRLEYPEISDPQKLKDRALVDLAKISKPRYNYKTGLVDLRTLPEYSHEDFALGDLADVIDAEMDANVRARIISHKYNVFLPWKCEVEIGDPIQDLATMITGAINSADFVNNALKPNNGISNLLKGFIDTFSTTINSKNGKLVWDDSKLEAIEIDVNGNETGLRVRITPGGIGITTDGGQTFRTAITGAGILANVIVVSELYALASGDGFTKLVDSGLKVFDNGGMLRVHVGQYAIGKFGLKLIDPNGSQTILDENGILQTWQEGRTDNIASAKPMTLYVYLPSETKAIKKALLRFRLLAFRAYETGAASGGGSTSGPSSASSSNGGGSHRHRMLRYWGTNNSMYTDYTGLVGDHNHGLPSNARLLLEGGGAATFVWSGGHDHNYSRAMLYDFHALIDPNSNTYGYVGLAIDWAFQGYDVYTYDAASDHTHPIPHTHSTPSHTHPITYDIYEGTIATGITVKINGTDRTAALGGGTGFTADQTSLNIAQYLTMGAWNTIEIGTNQVPGLGRIDASVFIQAMMGV